MILRRQQSPQAKKVVRVTAATTGRIFFPRSMDIHRLTRTTTVSLKKVSLLMSLVVVIGSVFHNCAMAASLGSEESGNYRSYCETDSDCDFNRFLQCDSRDSRCVCLKPLIWDRDVQSCRIMEGHDCDVHKQRGRFVDSKDKCIHNTTCITGKCQCKDGFLRNGLGTCLLSHGKPCDPHSDPTKEQCATRYLLSCSKKNFSCECKGEGIDHVWDDKRQKCVSLVGSGCDSAEDGRNLKTDDRLECVDNARCIDRYCECLRGYSSSPDNRCFLNYGQSCNNDEGRVCNRHELLLCKIDGKCGCEFDGQMVYDNGTEDCRMLAGEFCDLESTTTPPPFDFNQMETETAVIDTHQQHQPEYLHRCIQEADCIPKPHHAGPIDKGKGLCTCSTGMIQTDNSRCTNKRSYGMPCGYSGDCNEVDFLTCVVKKGGLGICECQPFSYYDSDTSKCRVNPGHSCFRNPNCALNSTCHDNDGYCVCNLGFKINTKKQSCVPINPPRHHSPSVYKKDTDVDGIIKYDDDCSVWNDSPLHYAKCNCNLNTSFQTWSDYKGMCVSLVGSVCDSDEFCVEKALCDEESKTCQCIREAKTTRNKTCDLAQDITTTPQPNNEDGNDPSVVNSYSPPSASLSNCGLVIIMMGLVVSGRAFKLVS